MTVPDGHGEVKTISVSVLGLYTTCTILVVALIVTGLIFWNYYSVRNSYTTTFELLQKKNNQYEAVLEGSKEQREVVETLLIETEQLRDRVKQLENTFSDVNKLLEQTGRQPVQLPPPPEKKKTQVSTQNISTKYEINRLNTSAPKSSVAMAGVVLAAANENYEPEPTDQELLLRLQEELGDLKQDLGMVENTGNTARTVLAKEKQDIDRTPSIWPVRGGYISSSYGWRNHPILNQVKRHTGIDIAVIRGTPVRATADGKVVFTGWNSGYGILVEIDHYNGLRTYYAHLTRAVVQKGDTVKKGQLIAYSGNTGVSSGDHLHYEIRKNGKDINPINYLS